MQSFQGGKILRIWQMPRSSRKWRWPIVPLFWCGAIFTATAAIAQPAQTSQSPASAAESLISAAPQSPPMPAKPDATLPAAGAIEDVKRVADEKPKKKTIALILPLSSKSLQRAAEAVRDGFIAASEVSGKEQFAHQVHLAADDGAALANAYRKAVRDGAVAVVAGITREGANMVAREAGYVPTLALNTPSDVSRLDANHFYHIHVKPRARC